MKVKCAHCAGVKKVHKIDPKTNLVLKNEWWWFADCDLLGNEQEVGYDCGKGHCRLYQSKDNNMDTELCRRVRKPGF